MTDVLLYIAIVPVIVILCYIYIKDKNKEPKALLAKLFIAGVGSCFLVFFLTDIFKIIIPIMNKDASELNALELIIFTFIGVALIEEFSKWIMVYFIGYKNDKEYDEFYDGIVYAVFVSLGFATFENILYVLGTNNIVVGLSRGVLAIPGHACFGMYMGYFLSKAKLAQKKGNKSNEKKYLLLSIIIPLILHGIYDYCLLIGNILFLLIFLLFVIVLFSCSIIRLKKTANESIIIDDKNIDKELEKNVNNNEQTNNIKNKYCSNCGTEVVGLYCTKCGRKQE